MPERLHEETLRQRRDSFAPHPVRVTADSTSPRLRRGEAGARQTARTTIIFLISAIAFAGFRPFGQAFAQFMIVWQR